MNKLSDKEMHTQKVGLAFFLTGCVFVFFLQFTVGLYYTNHYFIAHFFLGVFLPFLFLGITGCRVGFLIGLAVTSIFHFGYELWEDQLSRPVYSPDWDQIFSGGAGLFSAYLIFFWCEKRMEVKYADT